MRQSRITKVLTKKKKKRERIKGLIAGRKKPKMDERGKIRRKIRPLVGRNFTVPKTESQGERKKEGERERKRERKKEKDYKITNIY